MSTPLTPAKRPHDHDFTELDSKGKLQKSAVHYTQKQPQKSCPDGTVFRVLCPASKIDGVAGEDASALLQISQETGAKVRVEDIVPGCDEGIVVISCPDKEAEVSSEQSKEGGEEAKVIEASDDRKEFDETSEDKNSDLLEDSTSGKKTASMQKALLLVFERIVESEPKTNGVNEENSKSSSFVLRLLVLSSQVGCILGKAGSVIKQMSAESGAQIRILPRDKLPSCASASDELVQIIGEVDAVRKALQSVSQQLLENPPGDHDSFTSNTTGPSSHTASHPLLRPEMCGRSNHSFSSQGPRDVADFHSGAPPLIQKFREGGIPGRMMPSPEFLTFRLLCPHEKVGGVIGKGGAVVKTLQQDTGCEIKIVEGVSDSEDRIILISGPAHPDDRISPAQDAVLRVQARIIRSAPDNKDKTITAKLIISSNQIGCLLGKGGTIIAQMRKFSGAHIRIMGRDQIPKCASEGEEVVQINGDYEAVQEALLQITTRLRNHFFFFFFPSIHHSSDAAFMHQARPFQPYRREFSPPELYSNLGPPFHKFDPVYGPPPHGGFHTHDDRHLFVHDIHRPGMPPHISERKPWGPQGYTEGAGPIGFPDFAGGPRRRNLGSGGGSQPAIITSTTVEVVVPRSLVPIIYGEDGACLKQIRQISDARVTITEPKPGAAETAIIISGTPEQTHAAQSLIQAFVMSEREST